MPSTVEFDWYRWCDANDVDAVAFESGLVLDRRGAVTTFRDRDTDRKIIEFDASTKRYTVDGETGYALNVWDALDVAETHKG